MGMSRVSTLSKAIDGATATQVLAGTIIIGSGANAGNGAVSTAKAVGLLGVTIENTDAKGYAALVTQPGNMVDVIAGGVVAVNNLIASDATGRGVAVTPVIPGATLTQFVGIALTAAAAAGATFKMLYLPQLQTS